MSTHAEDPHRPLFHLSPPRGRLNDPNGLLVRDGVFHAFFQWAPDFPARRAIGWGHATSRDLLRWEYLPAAIEPTDPYDRNGCYSGSAVPRFDSQNDGAVFLYTGNVKHPDGTREAHQCAFMTDDLVSFRKHPGNPVIADTDRPAGYTADFRDPMVYAFTGGRLRMCIGARRDDAAGAVLLWSATEPTGPWRFDGELHIEGAGPDSTYHLGHMWECPNLFPLRDAATQRLRHVLMLCPQGVDDPAVNPAGRADMCGYIVGDLDIDPETGAGVLRNAAPFRELDLGFEFYAPQIFADRGTTDDALLLAWAGTPAEDDQPTLAAGWVHTMTVARRLTLRGGILYQEPAFEPAALGPVGALQHTELAPAETAEFTPLAGEASFALSTVVELAENATLTIALTSGDETATVEVGRETLAVDRTATGYPLHGRRESPAPGSARRRLVLLHDRSITEVFLDGRWTATLRTFLDPADLRVLLRADGGPVTLTGTTTATFAASIAPV